MLNHIADTLRQTRGDFRQIDDERAVANAAIARLSEIGGPQASRWVEALRHDPRRGLIAAGQYGGIAEVENALRGSAAQAAARQQRMQIGLSSNATPMELRAYVEHGPDGLKKVREANNVGAAKERRIVEGADGFKYYADTGGRVLPGVEKPVDRRETVTDTLGRQVYIDTGEPVIEAEADMTMPRSEVQKLFSRRSDDFKTYLGTIRRWEAYRSTPEGAAGDFNRLQILGKMLDEGSVVREGEAELMRIMGASDIESAKRRIGQLISTPGLFDAGARAAVNEAIEAVFRANARAAVSEYDSWMDQNSRRNMSERERVGSLPYTAEVERFRSFLEPPLSREQHGAIVEFYTQLGIPPDQITPEMIADALEEVQNEGASPVPPADRGLVPLPVASPQPGSLPPPRAATLDDIQRILGARGDR